ncbi:hypothetical protein L227DRAFT_296777 [Lentinus tigrinus ALCF2SS1-6]|uniref:Mating-type protein A-alpha/beta 1 N-terminal domain-containing protein n=1 Tax=Lentinus tigrinus ALCF2SS1-6 TaxID=1328759 RepID=A0A5C2RXW0_9APHY|nr:hypothetical protein L227DRAFT_296777 [Lentinus tigrinus ALCF2SS1-6]
MSLSLTQRLLSVEEDFLSALFEGGEAFSAFVKRLETLARDIDSLSPTTEPAVLDLVHATSMRLAALAGTSVRLFQTCDGFTSELIVEVDSLMAELSIADEPARSSSPESDGTLVGMEAPATRGPHPKRRREDVAEASAQEPLATKRRRVLPSQSSRSKKHQSYNPPKRAPLPSPSASDPRLPLSPPQLVPSTSSTSTPSRKRRLSDAGVITQQSQPYKRLHVGPRVHAVSDSFVPQRTLENTRAVSPVPSTEGDCSSSLLPAAIADLPTLDVLSTSVELQKDLTNIDLHEGFDLYRESYPYDGTLSLSTPDHLDLFIQSLLDPSSSTTSTLPSDHASVRDDTPLLSPYIPASPTTPSPASTPSCPSTPLLNSGLDYYPASYLHSETGTEDEAWLNTFSLDPIPLPPLLDDTLQSSCLNADAKSALYDVGDLSETSWSLLLEPDCPSLGIHCDFEAPALPLLTDLPPLVS